MLAHSLRCQCPLLSHKSLCAIRTVKTDWRGRSREGSSCEKGAAWRHGRVERGSHALQLLDADKSGGLDRAEFCVAIKKLVRRVAREKGKR